MKKVLGGPAVSLYIDNMSDTKTFCLGDVLSITDGRLLSPRGVEGVYDILNWMTGDNLFTHQLPRASRQCQPVLLQQFPELAQVDTAEEITPENYEEWMDRQIAIYSDAFEVAPLRFYESVNPLEELEAMVGKDRIVVIEP